MKIHYHNQQPANGVNPLDDDNGDILVALLRIPPREEYINKVTTTITHAEVVNAVHKHIDEMRALYKSGQLRAYSKTLSHDVETELMKLDYKAELARLKAESVRAEDF